MSVSVKVKREWCLLFFCAYSKSTASPLIHLWELLGILSTFHLSQRKSLLEMYHFNKETCLSCHLEWSSYHCFGLSSSKQQGRGCRVYPGVVGHFPWTFCNAASCCSSPQCQALFCMCAGHLACDCSSLAPLFWGAAFSFFSLWWSRHFSPATGTCFHTYYCFLLITSQVPEKSSALKWREI